VNAVCTVNPRALQEAEAADARLARGAAPRPLEGVPFVVKDVIETAGVRTTFGSTIMQDYVPEMDAISVARLKRAGAILIAKVNTPEFATDPHTTNKLFGPTRNPWNLNVSPGGSSGGTGAAIAAAMAPIGLGTDLGGSIRAPASFNGIVGLRPQQGRVPVWPQEFAWDTLVAHVHGPMARSVADIGLQLAALAGPDDFDPSSLPSQGCDYAAAAQGLVSARGRRVALIRDFGGVVPVDPEVAALLEAAARRFESAGCVVEEVAFDVSDLRDIISGTRAFNMVARYADRFDKYGDRLAAPLVNQVKGALTVDLRTVTRAERGRTGYYHRVRRLLAAYDHILTPTIGAPPFRLDEPLPSTVGGKPVERYLDVILPVYAFSVTGLPVIALPAGFAASGLPVGVQLVGRRQREDALLETAAAYEAVSADCFRRPEIDASDVHPVHPGLASPGVKIG
jgi:amidase